MRGLFGASLPKRNALADLAAQPGLLGGAPYQPNSLAGLLHQSAPTRPQPNYGNRVDGTPKGRGFLGEIPTADGRVMTELSVGVDWGEGEQEIPSIVPGLTPQEIQYLQRGGQPTDAIIDKAIKHARKRRIMGLSPFATPGVDY